MASSTGCLILVDSSESCETLSFPLSTHSSQIMLHIPHKWAIRWNDFIIQGRANDQNSGEIIEKGTVFFGIGNDEPQNFTMKNGFYSFTVPAKHQGKSGILTLFSCGAYSFTNVRLVQDELVLKHNFNHKCKSQIHETLKSESNSPLKEKGREGKALVQISTTHPLIAFLREQSYLALFLAIFVLPIFGFLAISSRNSADSRRQVQSMTQNFDKYDEMLKALTDLTESREKEKMNSISTPEKVIVIHEHVTREEKENRNEHGENNDMWLNILSKIRPKPEESQNRPQLKWKIKSNPLGNGLIATSPIQSDDIQEYDVLQQEEESRLSILQLLSNDTVW